MPLGGHKSAPLTVVLELREPAGTARRWPDHVVAFLVLPHLGPLELREVEQEGIVEIPHIMAGVIKSTENKHLSPPHDSAMP